MRRAIKALSRPRMSVSRPRRPDSLADASVASPPPRQLWSEDDHTATTAPPFQPAGPKPPLVYGPDATVAFAASARVSRCATVSSHRVGRRSPLFRPSTRDTAEPRVSECRRRCPSTPVSSAASPFFAPVRPRRAPFPHPASRAPVRFPPRPLPLRRRLDHRATSAAVPSRALAPRPRARSR
jgi:hypothetical protein